LEYRRLLDELAAHPTENGALTREEAFALEGLLPVYNDRCAELAASPVPDSLQHDDLHSNNACWPGEADDGADTDRNEEPIVGAAGPLLPRVDDGVA
jgi:hypothetical protein